MASQSLIFEKEEILIKTHESVQDIIGALEYERKSEAPNVGVIQNRDAWGTLHANAFALKADLTKLLAMLENDYGFKGELSPLDTQRWKRNHDGQIVTGSDMAIAECKASCINMEDSRNYFSRTSIGSKHSTIISLWTRIV